MRALVWCELLQCPAFPFSALSSQLLTLRHQSASTPMLYTGKNIHLNFSSIFLIARNSLEFPCLHGITSQYTSPQCFSIACTCGAIWCNVFHNTPWLLRVNKQSTCQACSITGPAYFFFISSRTECYKVDLMSSSALAFHWLFVLMTWWDNSFQKYLQHILARGLMTFNFSSLRNPVKAYHFASGHLYYSQYVFNRLHKLSIASHFSKTIVACCTRLLLFLTSPHIDIPL